MTAPTVEPRNLKGTQDRLPRDMRKRLWLFSRIRAAAALFGFEPLETPVIEYADALLGKYGDEERLVFRFKDYGDREVALRYDQTVPLARVAVQHRNELPLPFKRYEINRCWRAEKPQRGRDREFYQADFDILGADDLMADAEIIALMAYLYEDLELGEFTIEIGHRRLLGGFLMSLGVPEDLLIEAFRVVDKFDKIGAAEVEKELVMRGVPPPPAHDVANLLDAGRTDEFALDGVAERVRNLPESAAAVAELKTVFSYLESMGAPVDRLKFSPTIVRGLDYYTGIIFESFTPGVSGSIGSGGRYDNLCEMFGAAGVSGVGVGLGVERIMLALEGVETLGDHLSTLALVTVFSPELRGESMGVAAELRRAGVRTEVYLSAAKLKKQFKYADAKSIPIVIIPGEEELAQGKVSVKNMLTREQVKASRRDLVDVVLGMITDADEVRP